MNRLNQRAGRVLLTVLALGLIPHVANAQAWLNQGWSQRAELTVEPEKIASGETFSDITLLVRLNVDSLASVFSVAKSDGSDLVVTEGDGVTVLPHELVSFDVVGQTGELWFKASELSPTSDVFYLYYGNPDTTVADSSDQAWAEEHLAVYHFEDEPGGVAQVEDSGPGDGSNPALVGSGSTWSSADHVDAQIGKGWYFDGSDDWLYANSIVSADSSFTVSAWHANVDLASKSMHAMQSLAGFWDISFRRSTVDANASMRTYRGEISWRPSIPDAELHHFVWVMDGEADTVRFYLDGVEQNVRTYWTRFDSLAAYTGEPIDGRVGIAGPVFNSAADHTQGVVDEYRILEGTSSPARVLTEYWNQSAPGDFFAYRQEFQDPVTAANPTGPGYTAGSISVWPNPFQGSAQIRVQFQDPQFSVKVYDAAGRLVRTLGRGVGGSGETQLHWNGLDRQGQPVSSGIYYVRVVGERGGIGKKVLLVR